MLCAVFDDVLGENRADTGQGVELFDGRLIETDRSGHGPAADARSDSSRTAGARRAGWDTHHDLFSVHEHASPVETREIGTGPGSARRSQRIGDP